MSGEVYKPDPVWSENMVSKILRWSGVDPALVVRVDINCGSDGPVGWVILRSGEKVTVN